MHLKRKKDLKWGKRRKRGRGKWNWGESRVETGREIFFQRNQEMFTRSCLGLQSVDERLKCLIVLLLIGHKVTTCQVTYSYPRVRTIVSRETEDGLQDPGPVFSHLGLKIV